VQVVVAGGGLPLVVGPHLLGCDASDPAAILQTLATGDEPTLILGEHVLEAQVRGQAAVLGDRDENRPLALRVLPHGPLAISALAWMAAEQWQDLDPGLFVHTFDIAAQFTFSATWTPTVAGFDQPEPSLAQHLRSWLPGAAFVVLHHPEPSVLGASRLPTQLSWPGGMTAARGELLVSGELPASVAERVARLAGTSTVRQVQATASARERFGSVRAVEMCAVPTQPETLIGPISEARCPTCQMLSPNWLCPFCKRSTAPVVLGGVE
jgi:hypothetical protein